MAFCRFLQKISVIRYGPVTCIIKNMSVTSWLLMWPFATHIRSASAGGKATSAVSVFTETLPVKCLKTCVTKCTFLSLNFWLVFVYLCRFFHFTALKCPPGKEYKPCVNTCKTRTCQNRDYYEESTCSSIREECVCKSGSILHRADSAFCVTEDQCGENATLCICMQNKVLLW